MWKKEKQKLVIEFAFLTNFQMEICQMRSEVTCNKNAHTLSGSDIKDKKVTFMNKDKAKMVKPARVPEVVGSNLSLLHTVKHKPWKNRLLEPCPRNLFSWLLGQWANLANGLVDG